VRAVLYGAADVLSKAASACTLLCIMCMSAPWHAVCAIPLVLLQCLKLLSSCTHAHTHRTLQHTVYCNIQALDGDDGVLRDTSGKARERDIVQFVPFREYCSSTGAAAKRGQLAADTLAEVPRQLLDYMRSKGVAPLPQRRPLAALAPLQQQPFEQQPFKQPFEELPPPASAPPPQYSDAPPSYEETVGSMRNF
jgi:Copine